MAKYRLSNKAVNDLQEIARYSRAKFGEVQAKQYLESINQQVDLLAEKPELAQLTPHLGHGYRRCLFRKHAIYFKPAAYGIYVVRILHQQMSQKQQLR